MEYRLIYSKRRTIGIEVKGGEVIVRAPRYASKKQIDNFVYQNEGWIRSHLLKQASEDKKDKEEGIIPLTDDEIKQLVKEAKSFIPKRVAYYAPLIGVSYGCIAIRKQRSRWGSCSSKGNLNFNALLMLTPPEVIDSVVVHELCHRRHMDHSKAFYEEVVKAFPDYKKWDKWLKDNGNRLMKRLEYIQ